MATSDTEIANLALSNLGTGKDISSLETGTSQEALACRRFYPTAVDATLRDFAWPFATKYTTLGLVEADPNTEWAYSYRYPSDCVLMRRIPSGIRNDNRQTRTPYKIYRDDAGLLVYTDQETASIEYTARVEDESQYPADFVLAVSYRLSMMIAPRLTKGDPFNIQEKMEKKYHLALTLAAGNAANEQQEEEDPEAELIRERS